MNFGQMSDLMGDGREADREERYKDFARRYEGGSPPYDNLPDEEVLALYREVIPVLKGEDFGRAAREVFSGLSPEERAGFGRQLRDLSLQEGEELPPEGDERSFEPDSLARAVEKAHDEHPGILGDLLVVGGSGLVGGATGDGMTGGDGASGGGTAGGMTSNPTAKTVVAGLTAIAARKVIRE